LIIAPESAAWCGAGRHAREDGIAPLLGHRVGNARQGPAALFPAIGRWLRHFAQCSHKQRHNTGSILTRRGGGLLEFLAKCGDLLAHVHAAPPSRERLPVRDPLDSMGECPASSTCEWFRENTDFHGRNLANSRAMRRSPFGCWLAAWRSLAGMCEAIETACRGAR
jgi:hypothetical protein